MFLLFSLSLSIFRYLLLSCQTQKGRCMIGTRRGIPLLDYRWHTFCMRIGNYEKYIEKWRKKCYDACKQTTWTRSKQFGWNKLLWVCSFQLSIGARLAVRGMKCAKKKKKTGAEENGTREYKSLHRIRVHKGNYNMYYNHNDSTRQQTISRLVANRRYGLNEKSTI